MKSALLLNDRQEEIVYGGGVNGCFLFLLLVQDRFHPDILFTNRVPDAQQQVIAQVRIVVGKLDQMAASFFKNLEGKTIHSWE